MTKFSKYF